MKINFTLLLLLVSTILIFSFNSNPPNGRTGAPGEGTCQGCHAPPSGSALNGSMDITGLPNTIMAGNSYTVTVTVNNPAMNAARAGFQIVSLDETDTDAGTMSNPSASSTITSSGGRTYHEHSPSQNFSGSSVSWTVDWEAPAAGSLMDGDSVFLYGASIIANGGGSSGDLTRLDELRVEIMNPVAPPVSIAVSNLVDPLCSDSSDGMADAVITGGTAPFTIMWDNGETGMNATMLDGGPHSVSVTDALNEMSNVDFMLQSPSAIEITNVMTNDASCFEICDGSISLDVTGGTAPYSFTWIGPNGFVANSQNISNLCAGMYTLTVVDGNNCEAEITIEIMQPTAISIPNPTIVDVSCNGLSDGNIFVSPIGGTGILSVNWSNGASGNSLPNVPAGMYTANVTDSNGCTFAETFTVNEPAVLDLQIIEIDTIPCFGLFGTLEATSSANNLFYNWSNGVNTALNQGIIAGTYSVTITDGNGCTNMDTYILTEPDELMLDFQVIDVVNGNDGEISVTPNGGTSPYTYVWNTGDTDSLITKLDVGQYSVTVTDDNGCTAEGNAEVNSNCTLSLDSLITNNVDCFGANTGSASFEYSGTIINELEILWSTGDTSSTLENLTAGTYSLTISDGGTCAIETSFDILENDELQIDFEVIAFPTSDTDASGVLTASISGGTSPYTYEWSPGGSNDTISNLEAGGYVLFIEDANGCIAGDTFELEVLSCDFTLDVTTSGDICAGTNEGTASVTISGDANVVWSTGEETNEISGLSTGMYYVVGTGTNSCMDTAFFNINSYTDTTVVSEIIYTPITCEDSLASIEVILEVDAGPFTYNWSNGDTTALADSLAEGAYSLTVTNANGCITTYNLMTTSDFSSEITYEEEELTIYIDENGMGGDFTGGITNLTGGCEDSLYVVYDLGIYDCSDIGVDGVTVDIYNFDEIVDQEVLQLTILDTIPPTIICLDTIFDSGNTISCGPQTAVLTYTLGSDNFSDNCTVFEDSTYTFIFTPTTSGFYGQDITITDECGNTAECTFYVEFIIFDQPIVEITTTDVSCFGEEDGCIDIVVSGGTPPYQYGPENLCEIGAGTYNVTVQDANGCFTDDEIIITQPDPIIIIETEKGDETPGESDGFIDVTVTGGEGTLTFVWTENGEVVSNMEDLTNFPSSQYVLTVTDSNGCTQTLSTFIDVLDNIDEEVFSEIKIYPNPFDNRLIIEGINNSEANLSVKNLLGQEIYTPSHSVNSQRVIDTANLPEGIYLVQVRIGEQIKTYKLIKS